MLLLAGQLISCREQIREMTRGTKAYPRPAAGHTGAPRPPGDKYNRHHGYDRGRPGQFPQASGPGEGPRARARAPRTASGAAASRITIRT